MSVLGSQVFGQASMESCAVHQLLMFLKSLKKYVSVFLLKFPIEVFAKNFDNSLDNSLLESVSQMCSEFVLGLVYFLLPTRFVIPPLYSEKLQTRDFYSVQENA